MSKNDMEGFTRDLIKSLNKEAGDKVAYNLGVDNSPTHVKRWISMRCRGLDYIIANRKDGGLPEGRIVEIFGEPGIGKSHIAAQMCITAQQMGGLAVYIDTENATSPENLESLGVNIRSRFIYVSEHCTENVLKYAEQTMLKARAMEKDVPVVIIWDSVAATSPKAELDGDYDDMSIGLQARTISKGMRKITGVIGDNNVLFVCLNQTRTKIGVMYGDPTTTSGGKAIPFHSSVRIQLFGGNKIKNKFGEVVGIEVKAKTIKNKVAMPFRRAEFEIHFGIGIKEDAQIFDVMQKFGPTQVGDRIIMVGKFNRSAYAKLIVLPAGGEDGFSLEEDFEKDKKGIYKWPTKAVYEKKKMEEKAILLKNFYPSETCAVFDDPEYGPYLEKMLEKSLVRGRDIQEMDINPESYVEMQAIADEMSESLGDVSGL